MSVMATTLTRADLDALPDDGLRHELIDGAIIMTPSPGFPHQSLVGGLFAALREAFLGSAYAVVLAPFDLVFNENVVQPDLLVAPRAAFSSRVLRVVPLLVVEVQSPSTSWIDNGTKRQIYAQAGIHHYWLADPEVPSITTLTLDGGEYRQTAHVAEDNTATLDAPIEIHLNPAQLLKG